LRRPQNRTLSNVDAGLKRQVRRLEDRLRRWPLGDQALLSKEGRRQARAGKALGREPDLNGAVVKVDSPARRAAKDKKGRSKAAF
jgi:hypothetical protein